MAARGARLTVREAASTANVSVGTIYHYFGTKRALLLYGLDPEPAALLCQRFEAYHARYRTSDPRRYREALLGFLVTTLTTMRASVDSAIALGPDVVRTRIDRVVHEPIPAFVALIRHGLPSSDQASTESVERVVRSVLATGLLEPELDVPGLRRELEHIIGGPGRQSDQPARS